MHRLRHRLELGAVGTGIWTITHHYALTTLRQLLRRLGIENADKFTLKCFRAGRATQLAVDERSLGVILQAGEWRSAAFTRYIDEDKVDSATFLAQALAESDHEGDLPGPPGLGAAA